LNAVKCYSDKFVTSVSQLSFMQSEVMHAILFLRSFHMIM